MFSFIVPHQPGPRQKLVLDGVVGNVACLGCFFLLDVFGRDANSCGAWRDIFQDDGIGTNFCSVPDFDGAENFGPCGDEDMVAQGGVPFALVFACAAEGDLVVEGAIVANFSSFTDDQAHAVVDEEVFADLGAGVDFNAGQKTAKLGDEAGPKVSPFSVEKVGDAVKADGMDARIVDEDAEF